jgi:phospholipid/cholesterol/gamma-HCH transport system substrate-binding protein
MQRHVKHEITLGVFFFLVIGLLVFMFHAIGGQGSSGRITISARFDSAMGLVPDNFVMVAGVPIGAVTDIRVEADKALVTMAIDENAGLRADAIARIRAKSLLGEKFVELMPRSDQSPLLKQGDVLGQTLSGVEIDDILITLRPVFERLEPMAPEIESILKELDDLLKQLNETGHAKKETLASIIDRTDELLAVSNRILVENEKKVKRTVDNLDKVVAITSNRAPGILDRAERTLDKLETVVDAVPLDTMRRIPESYARADAMLSKLLPVVERLEGNSDRIDKIVKNLDILLQRVLQIDELALRKFLQQEGVNVNLTQDTASRQRIEQLETEVVGTQGTP